MAERLDFIAKTSAIIGLLRGGISGKNSQFRTPEAWRN